MSRGSKREGEEPSPLSRRNFLKGAGGVASGTVLAHGLLAGAADASAPAFEDVEELSGEVEVALDVNGEVRKVRVEPRTTLLGALRDRLAPPLTGAKLVCDRGQCGACTVIVDGRPAYACMLLAADLRGRKIRTIEGLGSPAALSPLQESFWKHDASMCGFCTPGFVMAIQACLERNPGAGLAEIKEACAGNACRCGTQPQVFAAALAATPSFRSGAK
jgi:aerobic-type carbon monoxide dehydrogenase small subunit (CoxS/CutS family)